MGRKGRPDLLGQPVQPEQLVQLAQLAQLARRDRSGRRDLPDRQAQLELRVRPGLLDRSD